jgi:hypothetical protein
MATSGTTRKDQFLTNLALTYPTGTFIGTQVAPVRTGVRTADSVFVDADDSIKQVNDEADVVPANQINFDVGTPYAYKTTRKALSATILDKTQRNEESIVKSKIRETKKLQNILRMKHEYRVASVLTSSSKVTNYAALSNTDRFDNASYANNFFTTKVPAAMASIRNNNGQVANTIVIPFEAAMYLANDTFVRDIKYQNALAVVEQSGVLAKVGLPAYIKGMRVIIADARVNNANEGETASKSNVWGKNVLIGYVPGNDAEDTFGIMTMEYEPFAVYEERMTNPKATKVIVDWDYAVLEADLTCWYLYQTVIS